MSDLRNHLFDVIERLKDPCAKTPIDIETAETICLAAKRLIESAEVEVKFRHLVGKESLGSDFLELGPAAPVGSSLQRVSKDDHG